MESTAGCSAGQQIGTAGMVEARARGLVASGLLGDEGTACAEPVPSPACVRA